jgi:putative transposase
VARARSLPLGYNVVIERFWRSIKYEDIFLKSYENPREWEKGIGAYILRYNNFRPLQSLADATLNEFYCKKALLAA